MSERKIRVLQGIRQGKIGGGESVLLSLVENLDRNVFDPVVLSFTEGPMVDRFNEMGVPVHVIYTERPFDFAVWTRVRQLMMDEKIDIVHAHGTRAASNMLNAAKKAEIPFIYTCHGWSFHQDQGMMKKKLRVLGEKYLTSRADVNICVSHANSNKGKKLFGKKFDPVVIQNSVDSRKFNPDKQYKDIRREFGIGESELLFSSIARFTWQKQPLVLMEAFARALKKMDGIRLLMVGDGEEKEKAVEVLEQLNAGDKIILEPFRQDVPDLLASTDVFVLPSLWEGLPVALLEAMAMGKTIIATDVDGTAEVIETGKNGLLIGTDNLSEKLTEAIVRIANDKQLRENLSAGAINRIRSHYNVETMTRRNEEIYLRLYENRK